VRMASAGSVLDDDPRSNVRMGAWSVSTLVVRGGHGVKSLVEGSISGRGGAHGGASCDQRGAGVPDLRLRRQ
jgi:hypothetical protein